MSTSTLQPRTDPALEALDESLTPRQARKLREWAGDAEVLAAGVLETSYGRELHVLVRVERADGAGRRWTDRMVFANGLEHHTPMDTAAQFGLPDPLRPARELVEQIQAAGGFVAADALQDLGPDGGQR